MAKDLTVTLPAKVPSTTSSLLADLVKALGVPREVLASDKQIGIAWKNLPDVLTEIPPELRDECIARLCVAVATGLFDSAINYSWNAAVSALRSKIKNFGLNVVTQITSKDFTEEVLLDLQDSELIDLCRELNLITEDGYFFLSQCRATRNNYSAAHPSNAMLDEHEIVNFVNRCAKYALQSQAVPKGVDVKALLAALKAARFTDEQLMVWREALLATHDAQRRILFVMLFGMYCDPGSAEEIRLNCLNLTIRVIEKLIPAILGELIDQHQDYLGKGDNNRVAASRRFFEELKLLNVLGEAELHAIISAACKNLMKVHQGLNNFYNEPPFAERLASLAAQTGIPKTVQAEYVSTVVHCGVGNPYGVSHAAMPRYRKLVRGFTPQDVKFMLGLVKDGSYTSKKIQGFSSCKKYFTELLGEIDPKTVLVADQAELKKWLA